MTTRARSAPRARPQQGDQVLQRLRISTKLAILVAIPLVSLLTLGLIVGQTVERVRIGGEVYGRIVDGKDLIADVLPPPLYLVETNLLVHQLATDVADGTAGADRTSDITERVEALRKDYDTRRTFWAARLRPEDPVRPILLDEAQLPAVEFWRVYDEEFLPALTAVQVAQSSGAPAAQKAAVATQLSASLRTVDAAYENHRTTIDRIVQQSRAELAANESDARSLLRRQLLLLSLAVAGIIAVVGFTGIVVVRSIRRPILELTDAADTDARERLPELVERVRLLPPGAPIPELAPHPTDASPELNRLASSFDHLRRTALDLASGEARLRQNVSEMFVNLGRRNQNLLNRTLSFISQLEEHERDPDNLDNLFRLDHLVTRMRRNAESLLVLAGTDPPRTWTSPVEVGDIVRGALSEVEPYERVEIQLLEPVEIRGSAAADLTHLIAELLENATTFSPPSTQVSVVGRYTADGYVLAISDQGIGMTRSELEDANRRLADPATFDTSPAMVLGLFVVSRLAARHDIAVQLADSPSDGVTAKVKLPLDLLEGSAADARGVDDGSLQRVVPLAPVPAAAPLAPQPISFAPPTSDLDGHTAPLGSPMSAFAPSDPSLWDGGPPSGAPGAPAQTPVPAARVEAVGPDPRPAGPGGMIVPGTQPASRSGILLPDGSLHQPGGPFPGSAVGPASAPAPNSYPATTPPFPTVGATPTAPVVPIASPAVNGPPAADETGQPALIRRRPGAQMPDTGPGLAALQPAAERSPEEVRASLASFQLGINQGRATPLVPGATPTWLDPPPGSDPLRAAAIAPPPPAPAAGPVAPVPAAPTLAAPDGLPRRVRGAQLPDTGPAGATPEPVAAPSPDDVRLALSSFQQGQTFAATEATVPTSPDHDDPRARPGVPGN